MRTCMYVFAFHQRAESIQMLTFFRRPIGKTSSEKRLYFSGPRSDSFDFSSGVQNSLAAFHFEGSLNERASNLYGQPIYGDAILASIGYMWKSQDLFCEDVTLQSYYRCFLMLLKSPVKIELFIYYFIC